ncbi:MAG: VOC family protein [Acidobacteriia bacterium]|nr:VOC family protein [Terriglobia bacterium]
MLASNEVIAFVATRDSAKARAFYENDLGLRLMGDEPSALVFDAHGTMLRISKVREFTPASYTVLGWRVPDIRGAVAELERKGVAFERYEGFGQDDRGIWASPSGAKVAWFKDPDGNTLSLTQFVD